jgi:hypothetical protein
MPYINFDMPRFGETPEWKFPRLKNSAQQTFMGLEQHLSPDNPFTWVGRPASAHVENRPTVTTTAGPLLRQWIEEF